MPIQTLLLLKCLQWAHCWKVGILPWLLPLKMEDILMAWGIFFTLQPSLATHLCYECLVPRPLLSTLCGTVACFNFVLCRVGGGTTGSLLVNFRGGNELSEESISLNYRILLLLPSVLFSVPQTLLLWEVTCRWDWDGEANLPLVFFLFVFFVCLFVFHLFSLVGG